MIHVEFIQSLIEINSKWQNGCFDSKTRNSVQNQKYCERFAFNLLSAKYAAA